MSRIALGSRQQYNVTMRLPVKKTAQDRLTDRQWERLVYGFAASVLQQGLDNGVHADPNAEINEWLPSGFDPIDLDNRRARAFYEEFGERLGKIVSDFEEEAAKRD